MRPFFNVSCADKSMVQPVWRVKTVKVIIIYNRLKFQIGLRGARKISVLRGSESSVRVTILEFRISVRFVLTLRVQNNNVGSGKIILSKVK